jgi:hypothetical protein
MTIKRDDITHKMIVGKVVAGEFVGTDDTEGREPGTYITIRLDEGAPLAAGPVAVTYLPLDWVKPWEPSGWLDKYGPF